jgi:hypothetical protein
MGSGVPLFYIDFDYESVSTHSVKYGHEFCGTRTKNDRARESQQQFTRPTRPTDESVEIVIRSSDSQY